MKLTKSDYAELSLDVYRIDSKAEDYDGGIKVNKIRELEKIDYQILKTKDNTSNGMQAMAVAPVKDGEADTSEVIIAYAGTNFDDKLDLHTDLQTIILGNKDVIADDFLRIGTMPIPTSTEDSQIITAEKFAEEVSLDYPNAEITTTGHSLGEFLALYISAENRWANVGFNGPDPYDVLSPEAKEWVKGNSHMLFNYRNIADVTGNHGGNGTGAAIPIDMDMAQVMSKEKIRELNMMDMFSMMDMKEVKGVLDSHRLSTWEFDDEGNIKINSSYDNKKALQIQGKKLLHEKITDLSIFAKKLRTNGKKISSNEKLFLHHAQALLTVEYIAESVKVVIESIVNLYLKAIDELEEIWERNLIIARSIGSSLSYGEILEALEAGGVTKYLVVFEPIAYYREKITEALKIGKSFENLVAEIKEGIEKIIETDENLAEKIAQGV